MIVAFLKGYPDMVGRRRIFVGSGAGPALYSQTTGDAVSIPGYETYIDFIADTPQDPTGTYYAKARPSAVGPRATWSLHWFVVSTNAEVANNVNLSTYSLQVAGNIGQY